MKQCPACNRTYAEEELTYCLADGSLLSTTHHPEITHRIPEPRATNSSPTEVLPLNPSPSQQMPQGRKPLLVYVVIGSLALLAGVAVGAWVRSSSDTSSTAKGEVTSKASSLTSQKESSQEEQTRLEREKQKPVDESKKPEAKNSESNSSAIRRLPQPSSGTWFVILGSYPKSDYEKANQRLQDVQGSGHDATIIDTDNYPGFKGGLWAVVMGPYAKSAAKSVAAQMKSVRSDVYIKSGW